MDCSPSDSPVHGVLQAGTLEWVALPSSRASSRPRGRTQVPCTVDRFLTVWATREAPDRLHNFKYHLKHERWKALIPINQIQKKLSQDSIFKSIVSRLETLEWPAGHSLSSVQTAHFHCFRLGLQGEPKPMTELLCVWVETGDHRQQSLVSEPRHWAQDDVRRY